MTKNFCLLPFISQEPYIIWLSFMVSLCETMIAPDFFFIFSKFWFSGLLGPKWAEILSHISHGFHLWYSCVGDNILSDSASQKLYVIWLWLLVHMCKKMISAMFFIFSKFWFYSWRIKLGTFQYTNVIPTNLMKNMFIAK